MDNNSSIQHKVWKNKCVVGVLFIFRVLDKQDAFHDGIPEDKNAGLHVPCSFLIQLLRAHSKNLGFVGVSLSKVGEG